MQVEAELLPFFGGHSDWFAGIETFEAETLELGSCAFNVSGGKERVDGRVGCVLFGIADLWSGCGHEEILCK